ncbi:unnamed protein product [Miscanthus lutarioriparius]|uniref:VWFA domain-containing protein n=1 Tax=Miscanthus lutarioriparius TaxID=422564 RepID=A0A811QDL0_9POAL|nr:unnamed protein product [Miscanthus lutarioriparius]
MHAGAAAGPPRLGNAERVRLVAHCNDKAPLEENRQQVLLELTDTSSTAERSGLDLVAVLDVSGSMRGWKLEKLKTAMKFVISKLSPIDRLSIVSFSTEAKRLFHLRSMTEATKAELTDMVENRLNASGSTNMEAGLETGLKVLGGRQHKGGRRVAAIVLMSDGQQGPGDATVVPIDDDVGAVYTFGFGADQDSKVLEAIARNSHGGTFYDVGDGESLAVHFSQIMAGLLSVVVQDLQLTVWETTGHSRIDDNRVDAGCYPKDTDNRARSVTVTFGYLYSGEVRKVMVDLLLPAVQRDTQGRVYYSPRDRLRCFIRRTGSASPYAKTLEVKAELVRRRHSKILEEASGMNEDLHGARRKLLEAQVALDAEPSSHPLFAILKAELEKLLTLTTWKELLACLLASVRSHLTQRYAGRHDVSVRIFATERMETYMDQASKFEEDPDKLPPSVDDDVQAEAEMVKRTWVPQRSPEQRGTSRIWAGSRERSSSGWAWATVLACTALAVGVILAGVAVFAVYLLYRPSMPYLAVSDAHLERLEYGQDGAIDYLQASITVLAVNNNSKTDASFSSMDLVLGFHGADVALLRAQPFVVPRESSLPLLYRVVSAGRALDAAGMQAMDEALKAGVVPFDLFGKARTRWKVGVFANLRFWMRISCRLRFFFPSNGTVMPTDRDKCRSR